MIRRDELEEIQDMQRELSSVLTNINLLAEYTANNFLRLRLMVLFSWIETAQSSIGYTLEKLKEVSDGKT